MTFTLRELHVRIPSPPRKPKVVQEEPQEVKKAKYKSPYLVPYTFKPKPPAHTGEYINSQIQHPESPYFSYLEDLAGEMAQMREDPNLGIMSRGLDGTEIVYEIQAAQDYYNEIHGTNKNCILPPTILVPLEKDQRNAIGDTKALLDDLKEMTVNAPFVKVQGIVFVNAGVSMTGRMSQELSVCSCWSILKVLNLILFLCDIGLHCLVEFCLEYVLNKNRFVMESDKLCL
ncbi:unnamed protein product [Acanthoscelides obtectus]|uniref:Uncharacterized protein n=2 Tax=Acanthoscelides obtectus TaxID=200917 RepID=A0A9P0L6L7_ACAOB|nr:unnamed protein product [Acanthoscelides obtectus]CAK1622284.1 hypothetical protein AOBTE_LOCUS1410 [Acanthoscelides obtectus]